MKFWKIIDKMFMFLGFISAALSAILDFVDSKPFLWQLACMAWISICYIKQLTLESYEEE